MKTITIKLMQAKGEIIFTSAVDNRATSVISGTIAENICTLSKNVKKFKAGSIGFSFAWHFDVNLSIDGVTACGTHSVFKNAIKFGMTLNTDKPDSVEKFGEFIHAIVSDILNGESQKETNLIDLVSEVCEN